MDGCLHRLTLLLKGPAPVAAALQQMKAKVKVKATATHAAHVWIRTVRTSNPQTNSLNQV
jgi:hypothetical protein